MRLIMYPSATTFAISKPRLQVPMNLFFTSTEVPTAKIIVGSNTLWLRVTLMVGPLFVDFPLGHQPSQEWVECVE
jgi:hypothetical protein